ncbi:hypothetical protein HOB10_02855 [Candidatus Parcubacteria bacterium]|jgi:hypothetical protein|nr:hypothetical protein [Candidatus Parcubacteria bacterium]
MNITDPEVELPKQPEQPLADKSEPEDLVQSGTVADFLQRRVISIEYYEQSDWNCGSGLLLMKHLVTSRGDHGLDGYEYFINGECVQEAINLVDFNPSQRLSIKRNGQRVWSYKPRTRPNVHMHEQALPEPT